MVMPVSRELSLIQFIERFGTEEACVEHLFRMRYDDISCPKCGGVRYSSISSRPHQFYCLDCHTQRSVLKGTLFENTKFSMHKWFLAIFLASRDKRGVSALTLSRELDLSLPTTMLMLRELRALMADRDQIYQLTGTIEMDEFFIGAPGGKQGRGTSKNKVIIALSYQTTTKSIDSDEFGEGYQDTVSEMLQPEEEFVPTDIPMYCKMMVSDSLSADAINGFIRDKIEPGSVIVTDEYKGYHRILETNNSHETVPFDPADKQFHFLHIVISNLKSFVLGTYHGLGSEYLQSYLDEFCYRFNRRKMHESLFDRLLKLTLKNG